MKVTRLGHSCLLVEEAGVKVMTDPGSWNELPEITGLQAILITHEHPDHCDIEKIKALVATNPDVVVITHAAVGEKLKEANISFQTIEPGEKIDIAGVSIESYGTDHAIIVGTTPPCRNTGYLIGGKLFTPGDALHDVPTKPIEVLALPTGGPWLKIVEAIEYAKLLKPKIAFPIHDAMYIESYRKEGIPRWVGTNLEAAGITFTNLQPGESQGF